MRERDQQPATPSSVSVTDAHIYHDALRQARLAVRYSDGTEEDCRIEDFISQRDDAIDDVQRLHNDKMKFFERTIELEREIARLTARSESAPITAEDKASDSPRTDAECAESNNDHVHGDFARQLERELVEAQKLAATAAEYWSARPTARSAGTRTAEPFTDDDLRRMWKAAGGFFYGPHVEHGSMPEVNLLRFLREMTGLKPRSASGESVVPPSEDPPSLR